MLVYWFSKVCFLSLAGSGAALAVWAAGRLAGRRLSCRWRYYAWLLPLALFLLPVAPLRAEAPAAPAAVQAEPAGNPAPIEPAPSPAAPEEPAVVPAPAGGFAPASSPAQEPAPRQDAPRPITVLPLPAWVWLGGAAALACHRIVQAVRLRRFLRRVAGDAEPWERTALEEQRRALGIRRPVALRRYGGAGTPFLYGLIRPAVYLPGTILTRAELGPVLAHELIHCRRRDLLVKQLAWLARTVHWFNPLAWLAEREIDYRCELACDEAAAAGLDPEGRRAYGLTLIKLMRGRSAPVPSAACLAERGVKDRLEVLMKPFERTRGCRALALTVALALTLGATALAAGINGSNPAGIYRATEFYEVGYTGLLDPANPYLVASYAPGSGFNPYGTGEAVLVDTPLRKSFTAEVRIDARYPRAVGARDADIGPASTFRVEMTGLDKVIESRDTWLGRFTVTQDGTALFTGEPGRLEHVPSLDGTQLAVLTVGPARSDTFTMEINFGLTGAQPANGIAAAQAGLTAFLEHPDTKKIFLGQHNGNMVDGIETAPFEKVTDHGMYTQGDLNVNPTLGTVFFSTGLTPAADGDGDPFRFGLELRPEEVTAFNGDTAAGTFYLSAPNYQDREFAGTISGLEGGYGGQVVVRADDGSLTAYFHIEPPYVFDPMDEEDPGLRQLLLDIQEQERQDPERQAQKAFQDSCDLDAHNFFASTADMPFTVTIEEGMVFVRFTRDPGYQASVRLTPLEVCDGVGLSYATELEQRMENGRFSFRLPENMKGLQLDLFQWSTGQMAAERYYCHLNLAPARNGALITDCSTSHIYNSHYTAEESEPWIAQIHA